jgi:hypothetical protein
MSYRKSLLNYCTHDIWDDSHGSRDSHKGVCRREKVRNTTNGNSVQTGSATKRGGRTRYARPATYESRAWMGRSCWRAQPSLIYTAVGYDTCLLQLKQTDAGAGGPRPKGGQLCHKIAGRPEFSQVLRLEIFVFKRTKQNQKTPKKSNAQEKTC